MPPTFHPLIFLFIYLLLPLSASSTLPSFHEAPAFRNGAACSSTSPIHIAMTLDTTTYLRGSIAAVFSVLQHSACPESIIFHFLAAGTTGDNIRRVVTSTFPYLNFHLYRFNADLVRGKISSSVRPALESPLNYARIYLADLLPYSVRRVIYLDSDLVLVDDIAKLWSIDLRRHVLGAPEYCHANFTAYFTDAFWSDPSLTSLITSTTTTTTTITTSPHPPRSSLTHRRRRKPCYFNTGVMVLDLWRWRRGGYTAKLEWWMRVQKRRRIYELGSLPPFLLVFGGDVKAVEHRWNQHGLGGDNMQGLCRDLHPGPVSLLHWSGKGKPWLRIDSKRPCPLDYLWAPYDLIHHPSLLPSVSDTW